MVMPVEDAVPFASRAYFAMLALLIFARGMDIWSTRVATPRLILEGNPIAKWLGWKWGGVVNVVIIASLAFVPLSAIIVSTASVLVAARNFQSAWIMRAMGEEGYRAWYVARLEETPVGLHLGCLFGEALLPALVGAALIYCDFAEQRQWHVPLGVGAGMLAYSAILLIFTLYSVWRIRRKRRYDNRQASVPLPTDASAGSDAGPQT